MVVPTPGNVDIDILFNILMEPAIVVLLLASIIAGLLRGSMESDEALRGNPVYAGMENLTIYDWLKDAGYGFIGGLLGLGIILYTPVVMPFIPNIPTLFLPAFGYAGRMILIKLGKKAEESIESHSYLNKINHK